MINAFKFYSKRYILSAGALIESVEKADLKFIIKELFSIICRLERKEGVVLNSFPISGAYIRFQEQIVQG